MKRLSEILNVSRIKTLHPRTNLSVRMVVLLALILSIMLIIISAAVWRFVHQTEEEAWRGRQREANRAAASEVDTFNQQVQAGMLFLSEVDPSLIQLFSRMEPETLQDLLSNTPALMEIVRVDAEGEIVGGVYQDKPVLASLDAIPRSVWFQTASMGEIYMGDVELSPANDPYMILAIPAVGGGVTVARVDMTVLWEVVSAIRFGETGHAYVIDVENETIIAHSNTEFAVQHTSVKDHPAFKAILSAPDYEWTGTYTNLEEAEVVGTAGRIPGTDWVVITEIARSEAYATSQQAARLLGGGILFFGVMIMALTVRLLQFLIFKPVAALKAGADAVAAGDLTHQVMVARPDEIGQVTQAFNQMVTQLRTREELLKASTVELAEANQQLITASRLKDEFLSTMSHELRTPLNAILGYTGLILMGISGEVDQEARQTIASVEESAAQLLNLINDVLDIAKIEAGRMEILPMPITITELIDRWRTQISILAENKGLAFDVWLDPAFPACIMADAERLTKIVMNLLSNAVKFTQKGGVTLEIRSNGQQDWLIEVTDTGIGIAPDAQEYIFDEFRQADGSHSRSFGGTGLGLAIVRKLSMAMGGSVRLHSQLGMGSTFTITLPLVPVQDSIQAEVI